MNISGESSVLGARPAPAKKPSFDVRRIREDFPILRRKVHGKPLVYLDNAASSQKPEVVIDAISRLYREDYANVHRGVHELSQCSTDAYEGTRRRVRELINAASEREIIFVRGTTEAINLVSQTYGRVHLRPGDEILITHMEHHSNIVPWQILCEEKGALLRVAPIDDRGELILDRLEKLLSSKTRLVALAHVSNALGTINPVREVIRMAHERGIPVLLDGAQAIPHMTVNVRELDVDFYAFSSHKMFGPSGVGVLYGKEALLEEMPPYQSGGDMISSVSFEKTTYNELPFKFEAGTPNIADVVGLGAAIDYVRGIGMGPIAAHEHELLEYGTNALSEIPGLEIRGQAREKAAVLSFILEGIHPHDIGTILDQDGIAIRTGHHCTQPLMDRFGIPATARASMAFYNMKEEIDRLVAGIHKVIEVFR